MAFVVLMGITAFLICIALGWMKYDEMHPTISE